MSKDKLPDVNSPYATVKADSCDATFNQDILDSINFIVTNLQEMVRLWVRVYHSTGTKDKAKKEQERSELRVTVGENIIRLSQLNGIDSTCWKEIVFPKLIDVVTSCKDAISQQ